MFLQQLHITNFKNIKSKEINFSHNINCFIGNNGVGKTNILDAIYYLSFCKSYFNSIDSQNINHNEYFFVLEGNYKLNEKDETIFCGLKKGQKKNIKRNGKNYTKFSEHIGKFPVVMISPYDINLITEGSETRRKFIDTIISQTDKKYLQYLIQYNKILAQRNSLLKFFNANRTFDQNTLETYNQQIKPYAEYINKERITFIEKYIPIFQNIYNEISQNRETVNIQYTSDLTENNLEILQKNSLQKDRFLQYTSKGIHKDDFNFLIDSHPVKKFGSQGQQKSFLIALKLSKFEIIKTLNGFAPILLLDDIFDKLDQNRVEQIIKLVHQKHFNQIFISDTHQDRVENIMKNIGADFFIFDL